MEPESAGVLAGLGMMLFVYIAIIILMLVGVMKVYAKAGQPQIAAIIPIWNLIALCKMAGKSPVWVLLILFVPIVNIVALVIVIHEISLAFGKGVGMTLVLLLLGPIGWMILGFGSAQYGGPAVK